MDIRLLTKSSAMAVLDSYTGAVQCPDIDYIQWTLKRGETEKQSPLCDMNRAFVGSWEDMEAMCRALTPKDMEWMPLFVICVSDTVPSGAAEFLENARRQKLSCNIMISAKAAAEVMNCAGELLGVLRVWQRTFLNCKNGKRLGDILAAGRELTGCPVALLGKNYGLLAWCGLEGGNAPGQEALLCDGHLDEEQFTALKENKEVVLYSVRQGVSIVGSLILWRPLQLAYLDYCLEVMAQAVSWAMKRAGDYDKGAGDRRLAFERFIYDLLDGSLSGNNEVARRAGQMGFLGAPYFACMVLKYENELKRPLNPCIYALKKLLPSGDFAIYGRSIVALIPLKKRSLADLDLEALSEYISSRGLIGGISGAGMRIGYFRSFYLMALEAMRLGSMAMPEDKGPYSPMRSTSGKLYYFEDFRILYMMDLCRDAFVHKHGHDRTIYLCHPAVAGLFEYDRQHKTNLLPVLYTYLLSCKNLAKTGRLLNYHRNTILNKIWKIEKITGMSLDNDSLYPALLFSCMMFYFCGE